MVKEGGEGSYDVPLLSDEDITRIVRRRSQGSAIAWWAFWLDQLLASLPAVQQSQGGFDSGGVPKSPCCLDDHGRAGNEVCPCQTKTRRGDV